MSGIDLAAISKSAASLAIGLAGTAAVDATLQLPGEGGGTYDPVTDVMTFAGVESIPLRGVLYKPRQTQGAQETGNESMFITEAKDIDDKADEADTLTVGTTTWNIFEVERVPGGAVIIFHLRK